MLSKQRVSIRGWLKSLFLIVNYPSYISAWLQRAPKLQEVKVWGQKKILVHTGRRQVVNLQMNQGSIPAKQDFLFGPQALTFSIFGSFELYKIGIIIIALALEFCAPNWTTLLEQWNYLTVKAGLRLELVQYLCIYVTAVPHSVLKILQCWIEGCHTWEKPDGFESVSFPHSYRNTLLRFYAYYKVWKNKIWFIFHCRWQNSHDINKAKWIKQNNPV